MLPFIPIVISLAISIALLIFAISWMIQMLKLSRQTRILLSVQIKMFEEYSKSQGIPVDVSKIYKDVVKSL